MKHAAWAIERSHFEDAVARETRPNSAALPKPFTLVGPEAYISVTGLLTPWPILAIGPGGAGIPVGTSYMQVIMAVASAEADGAVKSIRILMDSPGGMVDGVRRAMSSIRDASKHVTVQIDGACCSAAYWLASAADRIEAQSTATVGCLGVMLSKKDLPKGERRFVSSQTPAKVPDPHSKEGEQYQVLVDNFAGQLLDDVAANRGRDRKTVAVDFGEGASMPASLALEAGLIDAIVGPAIGAGRTDGASASAEDSQTPGDREKEDPMAGLPDPGQESQEETIASLRAENAALKAAAAEFGEKKKEEEEEEMAADNKEPEGRIDDALDGAGAVAADIAARAQDAKIAALQSQLQIAQLHGQHAQASERRSRIDALQLTGRIGTDDASRIMAERAYDSEQGAVQTYAVAKGVSLAVAATAQRADTLFSTLEARAAGSANAGLSSTSIGGAAPIVALDTELSTMAGMHAWCQAHEASDKTGDYNVAVALFRTQHPHEYAAATGAH